MDSAPKRPWYRLHWVTWVVVVVVLGSFIARQLKKEEILGMANLGILWQTSTLGWPFWHAEVVDASNISTTGSGLTVQAVNETTYEWIAWPFLGNVFVGLAFAVSIALVCERWISQNGGCSLACSSS